MTVVILICMNFAKRPMRCVQFTTNFTQNSAREHVGETTMRIDVIFEKM